MPSWPAPHFHCSRTDCTAVVGGGVKSDIGASQHPSANGRGPLSLALIGGTLFLGEAAHAQTTLPPIEVVATTPLIGSGLDRNLVPGETNVLNQQDLRRE